MTPSGTVRSLWERFEAREWTDAGALLAPDLTATWRASGEHFAGRDAYLLANRTYPGDWHATIDELVASDDQRGRVVARLTVTLDGSAETCIAFYRVVGGVITEIDEWWVTPYDPPEWRQSDI